MVGAIYQEWKQGEQGSLSNIEGKGEGGGKDTSKTPPSSLYFLDGSFHSITRKKKVYLNISQSKLDIKFELPI